MFSLRNRFGIPGVISVIALVFAMLGGAYAASGAGGGNATASKAKQGPRGKQGKQGKPGPAGPQGPAGPTGAKGDAGAKGATGAKGDPGAKGDTGDDGTSVTSTESGTTIDGTHCVGVGGSKFVSASGNTYACNGADGEDGETGFTATLPEGETETGAWAISFTGSEEEEEEEVTKSASTVISFPIPLEDPISSTNTIKVSLIQVFNHLVPAECTVGGVEGSAANPLAQPGYLCIFHAQPFTVSTVNQIGTADEGAGTSGAALTIASGLVGVRTVGTFAVTAPIVP